MRILAYVFVCFLLISLSAAGQQKSLYSQYMFNGLAINPAYAGTHDVLNLTALGRRQWLGMEGAPSTGTFSAHSPLKNEKVSLGVMMYGDKIGIFNHYSFNAIYAYKIKITEKSKLSFGLQAGVNNYVAKYSELTAKDANDPSLSRDDISGVAPSFGAGVYYYSDRFYAGLSVPYLVNNIFRDRFIENNFKPDRNYFFTSGAVFDLSEDVKVKASILVKMSSGVPLQADFNTNFLFKEVLWLGASLRNLNALNFLVQANISEQLRMGYNYEFGLNKLSTVNSGSHEFMLNYLFSFNKTKVVTPRYF
ncbi:MAG: type IX secretion system membrane protein PorP/SprF [Cytophagaceae bacterium]